MLGICSIFLTASSTSPDRAALVVNDVFMAFKSCSALFIYCLSDANDAGRCFRSVCALPTAVAISMFIFSDSICFLFV